MIFAPEALLVAAVIGVGILHTIVPDHWLPIALIARQRGWSRREIAQAAFKAGTGHVVSTLLIGVIVWSAGVAFATHFGNAISIVSSLALIGFGGWIAFSSLRDMRLYGRHGHSHGHDRDHDSAQSDERYPGPENQAGAPAVHGPERQRIATEHGILELSIFEDGVAPRFRLTGTQSPLVRVETVRNDGSRQTFRLTDRGEYWESLDEIPEPHGFSATVCVGNGVYLKSYTTTFSEDAHSRCHDHADGSSDEHAHPEHGALGYGVAANALHQPRSSDTALLTQHVHVHRHERGRPHVHLHDHSGNTWHEVLPNVEAYPPIHEHDHNGSARTALLLILGSSPMVEGIPAFFAAGKYGFGLIAVMAIAFGLSTIATYVALCVYSAAGLRRVRLGSFEKYGEVISGAFIALVGILFLIFPTF